MADSTLTAIMGREAAYRGGTIKQGVCSVAIRAQTPVVPCVILGTAELTRVLHLQLLDRLEQRTQRCHGTQSDLRILTRGLRHHLGWLNHPVKIT